MIEPTWSMPLPEWQPTGSFRGTILPPIDGPSGGTLIQLPCINEDWLPLVLGCLVQLLNPASWSDTLTDSQKNLAIARATELIGIMGDGITMGCCTVTARLTGDCHLQLSTDGGASWFDVDGWTTNIGGCVRSNIPVPVPPNPPAVGPDQQACNLAGFLASEVIQKTIQVLITFAQTQQQQAAFGVSLLQDLGFAFPITAFVSQGAYDLFQLYISGVLAHYNTAATDPVLKSVITCAIYNAIKADGYVTPANLPTVISNICGASYTYGDIIAAICAFVTPLGITNWQAMQIVGALEDEDCSACGANCYEFPWYSVGTFTVLYGQYFAAHGYNALNCPSPTCTTTCNYLHITGGLSSPVSIDRVSIWVANSGAWASPAVIPRRVILKRSGVIVQSLTVPPTAFSNQWVNLTCAPTSTDTIEVSWPEDFSGSGAILKALEFHWQGSNPFGSGGPCVDVPF